MRVSAIFIAALLAAVLVAGCGGSSGGSSGSSSSGSETTASSSESKGEANTGAEANGGKESGNGGKPEGGKPEGKAALEAKEEAEAKASPAEQGTKKGYLKEADFICKQVPKHYLEKLKALEAEKKRKGQKPTKSEEVLTAAVPPLYQAIEELEEVTPPAGEEQKAEEFIEAMEAGVKGLEEKPESKLSGKGSPLEEFANLTKAYGFKYCSSL